VRCALGLFVLPVLRRIFAASYSGERGRVWIEYVWFESCSCGKRGWRDKQVVREQSRKAAGRAACCMRYIYWLHSAPAGICIQRSKTRGMHQQASPPGPAQSKTLLPTPLFEKEKLHSNLKLAVGSQHMAFSVFYTFFPGTRGR
jgi:hypothetical protein